GAGRGVETQTCDFPHEKSNWKNDTIDEEDRHSKHPERRVLISGTGDGGLIDLLRYSFPNFRHDEAWKQLRKHLEAHGELDRALETVRGIEARASARGQQGGAYVTALHLGDRQLADSLKSRAELQVRRNIRPTLTGKNKSPFDLESSALNRFLATFTHAQYIHGGTASAARLRENGPYRVTFETGEVRDFDE